MLFVEEITAGKTRTGTIVARFTENAMRRIREKFPYADHERLNLLAKDFAECYFSLVKEKRAIFTEYEQGQIDENQAYKALYSFEEKWKGHAVYFYHRLTATVPFSYEYKNSDSIHLELSSTPNQVLSLSHEQAVSILGTLIGKAVDISKKDFGGLIKTTLSLPDQCRLNWQSYVSKPENDLVAADKGQNRF